MIYDEKKAPYAAHKVSQFWGKFLMTFFFIRVRIKNKNLIDKNKTYVFIGNHQGMLDIPVFALACDNVFRFLAKAELMKMPVVGYVIRKLYVKVDRKDKNDRARSMETMLQSLRDHISIFICPEGTRNKTEKPLLEFKEGAFRIAIESQLPLAVLVLKNSRDLLHPLRPLELSPGIMRGEWCAVIETKGMTQNDVPALKEKAANAMLNVLQK